VGGVEGVMPRYRKVEVRKQGRVFDDFFKIDELEVAHEKTDGSMSASQRRLIFERGDSAAVLIFNTDSKRVILVNQFKAPTLGKGRGNGWITETVAGVIEQYETPEYTAVREALEETGYQIRDEKLTPIGKFFSSPGGTSECIHLFYGEVRNDDKVAKGGGVEAEGEDIQVEEIPFDELMERIKRNRVEDPKVIIAAFWLAERLKSQPRRMLEHSCIKYQLINQPGTFIGYHTGPINGVKDVDLWVNSENEDMIMDRYIGRSISANIRWLGADRDTAGNLTEDLINNELEGLVRKQSPVRIGTVIETDPGNLSQTHRVHAVLHVATVRGAGAGQGVKADVEDLARCTKNVLTKADERNRRYAFFKKFGCIRSVFGLHISESIVIPMIGGGDGGLKVEDIAPKLFTAAAEYFRDFPETTLREVYFLAFTDDQKIACDKEIEHLQDNRTLEKEAARDYTRARKKTAQ
jgi:nudix-type nucleoside diphosphatase (YffH/AdpP family)